MAAMKVEIFSVSPTGKREATRNEQICSSLFEILVSPKGIVSRRYRRLMESLFFSVAQLDNGLRCLRKRKQSSLNEDGLGVFLIELTGINITSSLLLSNKFDRYHNC